jgi:hypothetical protein
VLARCCPTLPTTSDSGVSLKGLCQDQVGFGNDEACQGFYEYFQQLGYCK